MSPTFHRTPETMERATIREQAQVPYFNLGFRKINISQTDCYRLLRSHYEAHKFDFKPEARNPYILNTNSNEPASLLFEDREFNAFIHQQFQRLHEDWCGRKLIPTACYGMRMYLSGAYLLNHVDRIETHVISSTICICHNLQERWPLYIRDVAGGDYE